MLFLNHLEYVLEKLTKCGWDIRVTFCWLVWRHLWPVVTDKQTVPSALWPKMFYDLNCLFIVSCQTHLPFVYSSLELNVCLLNSLGNMWISCLCLYSSPKPKATEPVWTGSEGQPSVLLYKILMFDCSPSSLWVPCDSLCWSFLQKAPIKYT